MPRASLLATLAVSLLATASPAAAARLHSSQLALPQLRTHPLLRLRGGEQALAPISLPSSSHTLLQSPHSSSRWLVYTELLVIALVWLFVGTLFYSRHNQWPLAQAFFYAVDAGMSIGFCTDVRERHITSRAFTVVYILLGTMVVGGCLTLFLEDTMEGCLEASTRGYWDLLEQKAFERADGNGDGKLTYDEFHAFVSSLPHDEAAHGIEVTQLCRRIDRAQTGLISWDDFRRAGASRLLRAERTSALRTFGAWAHENRVYVLFGAWLCLGVTWGALKQKWDLVTAAHFTVSALATGGLTAPPVNADGILPADDALFVGGYCVVGIPLFAIVLSKVARAIVERHVAQAERQAIATPMRPAEFELARSLCCTEDGFVHLSDFVALHLLRKGKVTIEGMRLLRAQFKLLDRDASGHLTIEEACCMNQTQTA